MLHEAAQHTVANTEGEVERGGSGVVVEVREEGVWAGKEEEGWRWERG